jgi:hypothetical protein
MTSFQFIDRLYYVIFSVQANLCVLNKALALAQGLYWAPISGLEPDFSRSISSTSAFRADAGLALGCIRYLPHHNRGENCIHAPAAFGLAACCFGLFHGTNVGFTTDGAASWIDASHENSLLGRYGI